jgi:hypothetical protein
LQGLHRKYHLLIEDSAVLPFQQVVCDFSILILFKIQYRISAPRAKNTATTANTAISLSKCLYFSLPLGCFMISGSGSSPDRLVDEVELQELLMDTHLLYFPCLDYLYLISVPL